MKLKFSLLMMLLSANIHARQIIVYTYDNQENIMYKMITEMMKEYSVKPSDFAFIKKKNPCEDIYKDALLHLCFKGKNFEPILVRQNQKVLSNTFAR